MQLPISFMKETEEHPAENNAIVGTDSYFFSHNRKYFTALMTKKGQDFDHYCHYSSIKRVQLQHTVRMELCFSIVVEAQPGSILTKKFKCSNWGYKPTLVTNQQIILCC